jgi:hypothetical protein
MKNSDKKRLGALAADIFEQEYNYKSSDEFIEDYAHEVLGWGKEGESYYK